MRKKCSSVLLMSSCVTDGTTAGPLGSLKNESAADVGEGVLARHGVSGGTDLLKYRAARYALPKEAIWVAG